MENYPNSEAYTVIQQIVRELIVSNKLTEALNVLDDKFSEISDTLRNMIILNKAQLNHLDDQLLAGTITENAALAQKARIRLNALQIVDKRVLAEIKIQESLGRLKKGIYKSTNEKDLEKIIGEVNNMNKINWLQKGILASKSVCQVIRSDGEKGTGFVLNGGYLMTNFHVLPTKDKVSKAKIVFDYEEDLFGNLRKTSEFTLDENGFNFSPLNKLDYSYIKIKDNPGNPLSNWGNLTLDVFSDPQVNQPVNIIQHPLGQSKQIALTANKIIAKDGHKLFYEADTERGSSGSPVFNSEWKVIALHHAGKTEEDGGLVIDSKTGERRGANEGILIKKIVDQNPNIN